MKPIKSVQIMTVEACNRLCWHCPNKTKELSGDIMSFNTWHRIIDDLYNFGYKHAIHLHLMNEPMLDPELPTRIKELRYMFPRNDILFITNGMLLTREAMNEVDDAGVTEVFVSDYDDKIDFTHDKMTVRSLDELYPLFYNRGGLVSVDMKSAMAECPFFRTKLAINHKGDMLLCCSDYNYDVVFGNVNDRSLMELWTSPKMRSYREANLSGNINKMPLCKDCNLVA